MDYEEIIGILKKFIEGYESTLHINEEVRMWRSRFIMEKWEAKEGLDYCTALILSLPSQEFIKKPPEEWFQEIKRCRP